MGRYKYNRYYKQKLNLLYKKNFKFKEIEV